MERRRYPRLAVDLPVTMRYKGRLIPATMLNVSCGGMHIRTEGENIAGCASIEVVFDLPDRKKDVSVLGQIIRMESQKKTTKLGVRFSNLYSMSHKTLQEFINKNLN